MVSKVLDRSPISSFEVISIPVSYIPSDSFIALSFKLAIGSRSLFVSLMMINSTTANTVNVTPTITSAVLQVFPNADVTSQR